MKTTLIAIIGLLALGTQLPAFAGPDFQLIEQARKAKRAEDMRRQAQTADLAAAGKKDCPPPALVLPLDHGPRADTTTAQNRIRKERHAAAVEACRTATQ